MALLTFLSTFECTCLTSNDTMRKLYKKFLKKYITRQELLYLIGFFIQSIFTKVFVKFSSLLRPLWLKASPYRWWKGPYRFTSCRQRAWNSPGTLLLRTTTKSKLWQVWWVYKKAGGLHKLSNRCNGHLRLSKMLTFVKWTNYKRNQKVPNIRRLH